MRLALLAVVLAVQVHQVVGPFHHLKKAFKKANDNVRRAFGLKHPCEAKLRRYASGSGSASAKGRGLSGRELEQCIRWIDEERRRGDNDADRRRSLAALELAVKDVQKAAKLKNEARFLLKTKPKDLDDGEPRMIQGLEREARNRTWVKQEEEWELGQ